MDSLNSYDRPTKRNAFSRFDSLSRIDSLTDRMETLSTRDCLSDGQRRHSATQQDLSALRKSPRLQRRGSSSRFYDDPLPIPLLKAHSPVAKELKNSVPFNSSRQSEPMRRLEDRWQVSKLFVRFLVFYEGIKVDIHRIIDFTQIIYFEPKIIFY